MRFENFRLTLAPPNWLPALVFIRCLASPSTPVGALGGGELSSYTMHSPLPPHIKGILCGKSTAVAP